MSAPRCPSRSASVDELLPQVDYLTVHTPLTDETRGLIGREQINRMRPGVRLVNAARGGIYDEAALVGGKLLIVLDQFEQWLHGWQRG